MHRHVAAHEVSRVLHEDVFYPEHAPRSESPEYEAAHHRLTVEEDRSCFICGVKNSTLGSPEENPSGAKQMETHHMTIEWALANDVDADKLNAYFGLHLGADDVPAFVDHDERNLVVLCDVHHRHKEAGIHELTYPIWIAQKFLRDGVRLTSDPAVHPSA